jgi:hypothetical protein
MIYKCSLTVLLGDDDDADVIMEERVASDPRIGLDLLWLRVKEQMSVRPAPVRLQDAQVQLIGWADPIIDNQDSDSSMLQQTMLDRARSNESKAEMAKLVYEEQKILRDTPSVFFRTKEGGAHGS